jgi:protein involved in polysaccharide export with SLBB domain
VRRNAVALAAGVAVALVLRTAPMAHAQFESHSMRGSNDSSPPTTSAPANPVVLASIPAQNAAVNPDEYRLGPGDVLVVFIWGPISRTLSLEVNPEGRLFIPGAGSSPVAGLTLREAESRVEAEMRRQYRNVSIEVRLQQMRTYVVYLTGEVKHPGPYSTHGASRVFDVLPDSLFLPAASHRNLRIRHPDGRESVCDFERFRLTGWTGEDAWLQNGDVITIPRRTMNVGVWGGVARADLFELGPADSLSTLLELAGGPLPAAERTHALFTRWRSQTERESVAVALDDIASGAFNPPLHDGDNLYVYLIPEYRETKQVGVAGYVQRAGDYPIQLGHTRLSDAIRAAGGFREGADQSAVLLIRTRPEGMRNDPEFERLSRLPREQMTASEYESFRTRLAALSPSYRVDWRKIEAGALALDPVLVNGDVIRVERTPNSVRVDGQVKRPGVVTFRAGAPYRYYIEQAGGLTNRAARTQIRVTRSVTGQTMLAHNADGAIEPGDFLWVPERPDVSTWTQLRDVVAVAAQVATIIIAARAASR